MSLHEYIENINKMLEEAKEEEEITEEDMDLE